MCSHFIMQEEDVVFVYYCQVSFVYTFINLEIIVHRHTPHNTKY